MMYSGDEDYGDEITSPLDRPLFPDNISFNDWMGKINQIVSAAVGMSIHDLPDMQFRDSYDDSDSPEEFCANHLGIEDGILVDPQFFAEATDL